MPHFHVIVVSTRNPFARSIFNGSSLRLTWKSLAFNPARCNVSSTTLPGADPFATTPAFWMALSNTPDNCSTAHSIHAALGEVDEAFTFLQQAAKDRDLNLITFVRDHPYFDRLRQDSRYPALLKSLGLDK